MWEPPTDRSVPSPDTSEEGFEVTAFEPTSRLEVERPASPGQHIGDAAPQMHRANQHHQDHQGDAERDLPRPRIRVMTA